MAVAPNEDEPVTLISNVGGDAEIDEFKEAFKLFDKNDDGQITVKELKTVFDSLNFKFTVEQIQRMVQSVDDDQSGSIEVDEFINLMKRRVNTKRGTKNSRKKAYIEELAEAFAVFDIDNDGNISVDELAKIMQSLGETLERNDILFMIEEIDQNADGNIDFEEFQKMMMQGPSKH